MWMDHVFQLVHTFCTLPHCVQTRVQLITSHHMGERADSTSLRRTFSLFQTLAAVRDYELFARARIDWQRVVQLSEHCGEKLGLL